MTKFTFALIGAALSITGSLAAQDDVTRALSNNIGLVTYCADKEFIDADVAEAARARMRAALTTAGIEGPDPEAEAAGKAGFWGTSSLPIADRAKLFDQSVANFCQELVQGL
jgi:hypothetical protein